MPERTCSVPGCSNKPRSGKAEWCKKHYHRWYRHGSTDRVAHASGVTVSKGRRYISRHDPSHPLATPCGRVYVHQQVLYDAIGLGPHSCHWCTRLVRWAAIKGEPDRLTVDHLNGIGDDNRIDNLVPSCPSCNSTRALQARSAALVELGWWSHHDTVASLRHQARKAKIEMDNRHAE